MRGEPGNGPRCGRKAEGNVRGKNKHHIYENIVKRGMDICLAALALLLLSPLALVCALLIKLEEPGASILYRDRRNGRDGREFLVLKFRTMKNGLSGKDLTPVPGTLTRTGKVLRTLSLDEIPQFVNILRGEMSFIGPRPLPTVYYPWFSESERRRFDVRPGLTGLAQVSGRANLNWDERFVLDVRYVEGMSFVQDMRICIRTVLVVFRHEDVLIEDETENVDFDVYRKRQLEALRARP